MSQTKTQLVEGLDLASAPADSLVIDSSGRVLVGTSSARSNFYNTTAGAALQVEGLGGSGDSRRIAVIGSDNTAESGGGLLLAHQRSGSIGGNTILQSGDDIGVVTFQGNDGTDFVEAAVIEAEVDGTPGANDMPGRLVFSTTADGASSPTERMRISANGNLTVDTDTLVVDAVNDRVGVNRTPGSQLDIQGANCNFRITSNDGNTSCNLQTIESGEVRFGPTTSSALAFYSNTERARIDSSGRLLVGTISAPTAGNVEDARVVIEGNTGGNPTGGGNLVLSRGSAATTTGQFLGEIHFADTGAGYFGRIACEADGTAGGANGYPGRIVFSTELQGSDNGPNERMRIDNVGRVRINTGNDGRLAINETDARPSIHCTGASASTDTLFVQNLNASLANNLIKVHAGRAASSSYNFFAADSNHNATADREFSLSGDGNAYADGTWNNNGADYAEYFESTTGAAIPVGTTVVLENNKVRAATADDSASAIMGVIRPKEPGQASMTIGNTAWNKWTGKYLTDDFDRFILDEHVVYEWTEEVEDGDDINHSYDSHAIPDGITVPDDVVGQTHDAKGNRFVHYRLNPDYDPDLTYVPREERDEWVIVGLIGQVKILHGQPMNDRWIKMRDISDSVEEWLVR